MWIRGVAFLFAAGISLGIQLSTAQTPAISKAAAESCDAKIRKMDAFALDPHPKNHPATQISETEMNSYLALLLKPYYHPCLSSLTLKFGERHIQGIVQIDFDKLEFKSTQFISSLIRAMLSGKHVLAMEGNLIAESGMAYFELEQARFDAVSLPNFLVSEIITTVGKRQDPPFDPMAPTAMPFRIQRVDLHTGHITIYQ